MTRLCKRKLCIITFEFEAQNLNIKPNFRRICGNPWKIYRASLLTVMFIIRTCCKLWAGAHYSLLLRAMWKAASISAKSRFLFTTVILSESCNCSNIHKLFSWKAALDIEKGDNSEIKNILIHQTDSLYLGKWPFWVLNLLDLTPLLH